MSPKLRALLAKKQEAVKKARAIQAKAKADGDRELTPEETAEFEAALASVRSLDAQINTETELEAAEASLTSVSLANIDDLTGGAPRILKDKKLGFQSYGEFARSVRAASTNNGMDERLQLIDKAAATPTTYGSEGVGLDGGWLVPPEFATDIYTLMLEEGSLVAETDNVPVTGNSMVFPKDETTPWGTDGIRAYWENEAQAATQVKPKVTPSILRLHKLFALVPVTEELLDDTSALDSYLRTKTASSINWKANDAIINGTGAGQPQGILSAKALVVTAKDSGQATKTLSVTNVANMFAQLAPASVARAQWLIAPDCLPSLLTMTLGNYPIYTPPGVGIKENAFGLLFGRPIRTSQHNAAFSSQGDIILGDFSSYRTITKRGGQIQTDISIHLYFDAGAVAFRAIYRIDGQSKIQNQITQYKGSNPLSPFVTLAAR